MSKFIFIPSVPAISLTKVLYGLGSLYFAELNYVI